MHRNQPRKINVQIPAQLDMFKYALREYSMTDIFHMGQGPQLQNYIAVMDKVSGLIIPRKIKKKTMEEAIEVLLETASCKGYENKKTLASSTLESMDTGWYVHCHCTD